MSDLHRRLMRPPVQLLPPRGLPRGHGRQQRNYDAVSWKAYFDTHSMVEVDEKNQVSVYTSGHRGPVLVLLHGGGFSALTFSLLSKALTHRVECRVVAMDLRGHGETVSDDEYDLSFARLTSDVYQVLKRLYDVDSDLFVLIGHSMGGALAAHIANHNDYREHEEAIKVVGLCVIDVVEGTAVDALSGMQSYLRGRPSTFKSLSHAIEWSVRSGHVRNIESAKVSMPGQLKNIDTSECATVDIKDTKNNDNIENDDRSEYSRSQEENAIKEEDENGEQSKSDQTSTSPTSTSTSAGVSQKQYTWRVDLAKFDLTFLNKILMTEPHWLSWFRGLSSRFLSSSATKLLVLAGVDRLDRELTVGQMQGKFQMQVLPQAGHAVHEDLPDDVADVLATFLVRNKFAVANEQGFSKTFPAC